MRKVKNIDLDQLVEKGILEESSAEQVWSFYLHQKANAPNRLSIVLSVLGATLVGLGIILIVAHNWDQLSRPFKTILAFLPMVIGQVASGYALKKHNHSPAWKESTAVFLFFSVGGCLGMISQIYNLEGELGSFLLTWILLCLPMVYVMHSAIVSFLYIGGITWYATNCGYSLNYEPYLYWGLLAAILPFYYRLYQHRPESNAFTYHSWAIALSVLICLGLWSNNASEIMWVAYVTLLALYFLVGSLPFFRQKRYSKNPFIVIGTLGTIGLFLAFTFQGYWEEVILDRMDWSLLLMNQEFWVSLLLIAVTVLLLFKLRRGSPWKKLSPVPLGFLVFVPVFFLGYNYPLLGMVLSNIFVMGIGIFYIWRGNRQNKLGLLNLGLMTITVLIICRFFDLDISFVTRGLLFVMVGVGFFIANYQLIKKRTSSD